MFDPKDCRNEAVAKHKKASHLVAFFGDGSFGWFNEVRVFARRLVCGERGNKIFHYLALQSDLQSFEDYYEKNKGGSKKDKAVCYLQSLLRFPLIDK